MGNYIVREPIASETVKALKANVVVNVRQVGSKLVVDATEFAPARVSPVSPTRMEKIIREAAKTHMDKPGKPRQISDTIKVVKTNFLDDGGHCITSAMRVRTQTFVLGK